MAKIVKRRKSSHYVNNKTLYEHMKVYHAAYHEAMAKGEEKPRLPDYVGECILLISKRLGTKNNWRNYSFLEEMQFDGIENCIRYIHNFDPVKYNNPFAYITKIMKWAFIRRIHYEKHQQYLMLKNAQNCMIQDQLSPNMVMGESMKLYDNLHDLISEYEEKHNIKMKYKKKKG